MKNFVEQLVSGLWNRLRGQVHGAWREGDQGKQLDLGVRVVDGEPTKRHFALGNIRRATHVAVLGKTGTGKSSLLKSLAEQDIEAGRGFLFFDMHGDVTKYLLGVINRMERRLKQHLHHRLILIDPADPIVSPGFNPLEQASPDFVRIAEFAEILKRRWHLDTFGARTDELLRNSLYALVANGLTLVELALFLTHTDFRARCLKQVDNAEVRQYFELRYNPASEAMRTVMREPILNKTSAFTADPHFRHIVGQASTFSPREAMDQAFWVIVNLEKGKLGDQALTLGSLILSVLTHALFTRESRSLFSVYADEVQNLVAYGSGIETILSEARKFAVAIVSANQFLDQYPAEMRAALMAVGTHVFFQLSSNDAAQVAQALDGGRPLAERLKNLYPRHCIVKSGAERWAEVEVRTVRDPGVDYTDLLTRARYDRGRVRAHIEREIAKRQAVAETNPSEAIHDWQ